MELSGRFERFELGTRRVQVKELHMEEKELKYYFNLPANSCSFLRKKTDDGLLLFRLLLAKLHVIFLLPYLLVNESQGDQG